jgi:hypothetical protein
VRNPAPVGVRAAAAIVVALALTSAGCKTADPLGGAERVREGMTLAETRRLLGPPTYVEQSPDGRAVETYEALQTIFGSYGIREREEALEIRQFSVLFNREGRVVQTLSHRGVLEGWTMLHSRSFGPEITPDKLIQARTGGLTRGGLEQLFGPPSLARLTVDGGQRLEWIYDRIESSAVVPGRVFRSVEIILDAAGNVTGVNTLDRVFPTWRRGGE